MAARSGASWVGKLDDDSLPNPHYLAPFLRSLRCHRYAFAGSIQFAGYVPRSYATGIRGLPCAQGSGLHDALLTFSRSIGRGKYRHNRPGERPACDHIGSVLPYPRHELRMPSSARHT